MDLLGLPVTPACLVKMDLSDHKANPELASLDLPGLRASKESRGRWVLQDRWLSRALKGLPVRKASLVVLRRPRRSLLRWLPTAPSTTTAPDLPDLPGRKVSQAPQGLKGSRVLRVLLVLRASQARMVEP